MNKLKLFFSPARDARNTYLEGLQRGATRPPASDLIAIAIALFVVWLALAGLIWWMCDALVDDKAFLAFVCIVLVVCLRKAIYVTVLTAHVVSQRTPPTA